MGISHSIISDDGAVKNTEVDIDDLLDVVADSHRRFLLRCLLEQAKPMAVADLATDLAAWEENLPKSQISKEQTKSTYIELYHRHIPKMEAVGLLSRNQDKNTVEVAKRSEALVSELV